MLAGVRPFDGEHMTEAFAAVIHNEPAWDALPENAPARVCAVLERCLQKDPKDRARDIGDVLLALDGAFASRIATAGTTPAADASMRSHPLWRPLAAYTAVLIAGIALAVLGVWTMASLTAPAPQLSRFTIVPPSTEALNTASPDRGIAISPDGSHWCTAPGPEPAAAGTWSYVRSINSTRGRCPASPPFEIRLSRLTGSGSDSSSRTDSRKYR